uniref:5'-nucleotidase n=1 Tax=Sergentomyia schwetzi TaxID=114605 RepID=A0A6B9VL92_9DIPT|nr:salivary 5'-nucleotidase [Sergentomyia schwetzi]
MFFVKIFLFLLLAELGYLAKSQRGNIEIVLLHTNDMHARFVETNRRGNVCHEKDKMAKQCYGGFSRISSKIKQFRKGNNDVLFLNAGDTFQGTPAYTIFKHNITSEMMNLLKFDGISLGNHEFDDDIRGLAPYLKDLKVPVLAANIDASGEPSLTNLKPSIIVTKNHLQIGIIGYLSTDTKFLSKPNKLKYTSEVSAINEEAKNLRARGANVIIAVGHAGLTKDIEIAKNCPEVDLIVGGHSHTFLYTGTPPDIDTPKDNYPVVVTQPSGKKVPIVQAYAYTKYLGYLKLKFNSTGSLLSWKGQPILLDHTVKQDPVILKVLKKKYLPAIDKYGKRVVGVSRVFLNGDYRTCRFQECNMGNLLTDAFLYGHVASNQDTNISKVWTDASIVLYQAGGIRAAIDVNITGGSITRHELDNVLPFSGDLSVSPVPGSTLRKALEHAVHRYTLKQGYGEFLQVSGLQVVYDLNQDSGSRVKSVKVKCNECSVPRFEELDENRIYNVIINKFIKDGGDGFEMFKDLEVLKILPDIDIEMVDVYIGRLSPIYPAVEGRIIVKGKPKE